MDMLFFVLMKVVTMAGSTVSNILFKRKLERAATALMVDDGGKQISLNDVRERTEQMMDEVLNGH